MNPVSIFNVATKIETPLMLAALAVLVLFALYRSRLSDANAKRVFIVALVAIVLGIGADLLRLKTQPQTRYWVDGQVTSPPASKRGVPRAVVYLETHGDLGIRETCSDEAGYFRFEIPPTSFGTAAQLWATAPNFEDSSVTPLHLSAALDVQKIGLITAPATGSGGTQVASAEAENRTPHTAAALRLSNNAVNSCLNGDWPEQLSGRPDQLSTLKWHFTVLGSTMKITRQDNFVSGTFTRSEDGWKGDLNWGNGTTWPNVVLTPSEDCRTVATNQFWYYKR